MTDKVTINKFLIKLLCLQYCLLELNLLGALRVMRRRDVVMSQGACHVLVKYQTFRIPQVILFRKEVIEYLRRQ